MVYSFFRNHLGQIYSGCEMSARKMQKNAFVWSVPRETMV